MKSCNIPLLLAVLLLSMGTKMTESHAKKRWRIARVHTGTTPRLTELISRPSRSKPYAESWSLWGESNKGWLVYASFFVTKMHPFVGTRIGVQMTLVTPGGQILHRLKEFKKKHFRTSKQTIDMRVKQNRFVSNGKQGKVRFVFKDAKCNLTFKRAMPGFRFQGGTVRLGSRKLISLPFAPKASLSGSINWKGKTIRFQGTGYLDRSWQHEPHQIAKRWYNLRAIASDYTILLSQLTPTKTWQSNRMTSLSIGYKGKWLGHLNTKQVFTRFTRYKKDKRSGYRVPKQLIVKGTLPNGTKVILTAKHIRSIHTLDVLAHVPGILRFFIQKLITKPFLFRDRVRIHMQLKTKETTHQRTFTALSETVFLNH
jgi:hypothetical protein